MINDIDKKVTSNVLDLKEELFYKAFQDDSEMLLENVDRYKLTKLEGPKLEVIPGYPIQISTGLVIYNLSSRKEWYCNDISANLYEYLVEECRKGKEVSLRITKDMIAKQLIFQYEKYSYYTVDINNLKNCTKDFNSISYNPKNNDKFIVWVDVERKFLEIHEFIDGSKTYVSKYIHAIYNEENNTLKHMDYSLNQYNKAQYESIVINPFQKISNCDNHKKIWEINGDIDIDTFYKILFSMYVSNEEFIKELFKK